MAVFHFQSPLFYICQRSWHHAPFRDEFRTQVLSWEATGKGETLQDPLGECLLCSVLGRSPGGGRTQQPTPVFLPGESHGQRSLVGYSTQVAESDTTESDLACMHSGLLSQVWKVKTGTPGCLSKGSLKQGELKVNVRNGKTLGRPKSRVLGTQ